MLKFNPRAIPYTPRPPLQSCRIRPVRHSVLNKRQRLFTLFPFRLRECTLNSPQCAAIRLLRKPLVMRLHQLKEIQMLKKDVEAKVADLQRQGELLARLTSKFVHSISFVDPHPPLELFNGHLYWWNWKSIKIGFRGFNSRRFTVMFDFSSYISSFGYIELLVRSPTYRSVEAVLDTS
jgi:hypothetical protein